MAQRMAADVARKRRSRIDQQWTDGGVWRLVRGEDFQCDLKTFRSDLHNHAQVESRRRDKHVRCETSTKDLPEGTIDIRFYETGEPLPDNLSARHRRGRPRDPNRQDEKPPSGLALLACPDPSLGYSHVRENPATGDYCPTCKPDPAAQLAAASGTTVEEAQQVIDEVVDAYAVPRAPVTDEEIAALPVLKIPEEFRAPQTIQTAQTVHTQGLHTGSPYNTYEPIPGEDPAEDGREPEELVVRASKEDYR